jgi:cytochrome c oxidase subunit 2
MPIEVKVVSQADFDAWVASKTTPAPSATNATAGNAAAANTVTAQASGAPAAVAAAPKS